MFKIYIFSLFGIFSCVTTDEVLPEKHLSPKHFQIPSYNAVPYSESKKPYEYAYAVKDRYSGANFDAAEISDGNVVNGHYSVLLPDGRTQRTEYTVNGYDGYKVDVSYEGEAIEYHPLPNPSQYSHKPSHETLIPEPSRTVYHPSLPKAVPEATYQSYPLDVPEPISSNLISQPVEDVPYSLPIKESVTNPPAVPRPTSYKPVKQGPIIDSSATLFRQAPKDPAPIFRPIQEESSKVTTFQGSFKMVDSTSPTTPIPPYEFSTTARSYQAKPQNKKFYGFKMVDPGSVQQTTPYSVPKYSATARSDTGDSSKTFDMAKKIAKKVYGFKFASAKSDEAESRKDSISTFNMPF